MPVTTHCCYIKPVAPLYRYYYETSVTKFAVYNRLAFNIMFYITI